MVQLSHQPCSYRQVDGLQPNLILGAALGAEIVFPGGRDPDEQLFMVRLQPPLNWSAKIFYFYLFTFYLDNSQYHQRINNLSIRKELK